MHVCLSVCLYVCMYACHRIASHYIALRHMTICYNASHHVTFEHVTSDAFLLDNMSPGVHKPGTPQARFFNSAEDQGASFRAGVASGLNVRTGSIDVSMVDADLKFEQVQ